jgi:iron(III) transport system substrate-binding protein
MQRTAIIWIFGLSLAVLFLPLTTAADQQIIEGARKEGKLMIYSLLAVPDHSIIVNRFREKYPFIDVSLIQPGASERITARVMTEALAGQYLVDVVGVSRLNMSHLIQRGLLMSYDSPERQGFDPAFKDKKGFWTAFYVNPSVMSYNTHLVPPPAAPKSYPDLLDARWKGKLVLGAALPSIGTPLTPRW